MCMCVCIYTYVYIYGMYLYMVEDNLAIFEMANRQWRGRIVLFTGCRPITFSHIERDIAIDDKEKERKSEREVEYESVSESG